jgi:hypothetical protein
MGNAAFFAPEILTSPSIEAPPVMINLSILRVRCVSLLWSFLLG